MKRKLFQEALGYCTKAVEADAANREAHYRLSTIDSILGRNADAEKERTIFERLANEKQEQDQLFNRANVGLRTGP